LQYLRGKHAQRLDREERLKVGTAVSCLKKDGEALREYAQVELAELGVVLQTANALEAAVGDVELPQVAAGLKVPDFHDGEVHDLDELDSLRGACQSTRSA